MTKTVAVALPCFNEAAAIGLVIDEVRRELPSADIYVFDNGSTDESVAIALDRGVAVSSVLNRGKGRVVSRIFAEIEADICVLCDADGEYSLANIQTMLDAVFVDGVDMVVGVRDHGSTESSFRRGHRFGNWAITGVINRFFGAELTDVLSGLRVFSRRFIKSAPIFATGFEVETELTVHALVSDAQVREVHVDYRDRVAGSESKLRTVRDGFRILKTVFFLVRDVRPLLFFSIIGALLFITGLVFGLPVIAEFMVIGEVPRFPTAILATGLMVLSGLSLFSGLILDSVAQQRREIKRLHYLQYSSGATSS